MNMNDVTRHVWHPDDTRGSNIIKKEIDIKTEHEFTEEYELKTAIEGQSQNGIKDEFADYVYHNNTNTENIYIKSEPLDTRECGEHELESAHVVKTESCDTRKTYCLTSADDVSHYNYNTNIIITEEINIKSEYGDDCEYEEGAAGHDTDSETSSINPNESYASVVTNKFKETKLASNKCNTSKKIFEQACSLLKHEQVHSGEKLFACDQCNKTFSRMGNLLKHKQIHSGEKLFACDQCNKTFSRMGNLLKHKQIHSGEKPFKCGQCNKSFAHKRSFIRHQTIHSGEKQFKCEHCNKTFNEKGNLNRHIRVHTGEKPFKCDQCDKAYPQSTDLSRHKTTHSGEMPFKCDQCNKAYSGASLLSRHKLIHTGVKPFKCDQCNKAFLQSTDLTRHKGIHSREASFQ